MESVVVVGRLGIASSKVLEDGSGRAISSGVTERSEGGLAIMADRAHDDLRADEMRLSANHEEEMINVLFRDSHVYVGDTSDYGLTKAGQTDNIYTCSGAGDVAAGDTGHVGNTGTRPYHESSYDSCLITD